MVMTTRIEVRPGPAGPRVDVASGVLRARRVGGPPGVVRVALVATEALLLAGDEVRVELCVDGAVDVEIVETAGTVAYDMRGGSARWDVAAELGNGARLTWAARPFVVSSGADVHRSTCIAADAGCTAILRETLVLGRAGEVGGALRSVTEIAYGDAPLLVERLDLGVGDREGWATLHGARCLDTLTAVGFRLPDAPGTLQLDGCGSVTRWIGDELHRSTVSFV
jgi:urease accessory protein